MSYWNPNARFEKHRHPQVRLPCIIGDLLVPAEFDDLGDVIEESLVQIEKALELLAQYLTDRDLQIFLGMQPGDPNSERVAHCKTEAMTLRRVAPMLRAVFAGKILKTVRL